MFTAFRRSSSGLTTRRPPAAEGNTGEMLLVLVSAAWTTSCTVWASPYPPSGSPAGEPRAFHRQRQPGQHPLLPDQAWRCGRGFGESLLRNAFFKKLTGEDAMHSLLPQWLDREKNTLQGKVIALPTKEDIDFDIAEHLIVELYSK